MNQPIVRIEHGKAMASSVDIANSFDKEHKNVLRAIDGVLPHVSEKFSRLNFEPSNYEDGRGKQQPCYHMTKNGFAMIVLGFTGDKAIKFREAYITRFDEMEGRRRRQAYRQNMLTSQQIDERVQVVLGKARSEMTLSFAHNLMIARGLHIPPISRDQMIKLLKTGVIDGYFDNRQWHVYQDSFADWLDQRKNA